MFGNGINGPTEAELLALECELDMEESSDILDDILFMEDMGIDPLSVLVEHPEDEEEGAANDG